MEHNIACPKNDLTTVFVARSTDPAIKKRRHYRSLEPSDKRRDFLNKIYIL